MKEKLKEVIKKSKNIVFLGGAGVSTESEIPDFRSKEGLYQKNNSFLYPAEEMLSHRFFWEHPSQFYKFYREKMIYPKANPNDAHRILANLEKENKLSAVITQNIDGLHQKAGSKNVLELHGSVHRNVCTKCNKDFDLDYILNAKEEIPLCNQCGSILKPDVVLYGETLNEDVLEKAIAYISKADTLIVGGTSLRVFPAANLLEYFQGENLVIINQEETPYDAKANLVINSSIGKTLFDALKSFAKDEDKQES